MLGTLNAWARELKAQVLTLWFCRSDPRTPLGAKIVAAIVVAYAFSPIDLIPDFIPVLGYLDDLILVPLGIYVALKLIPTEVIVESRKKAEASMAEKRAGVGTWLAAAAIVAIWLAVAYLAWQWLAASASSS